MEKEDISDQKNWDDKLFIAAKNNYFHEIPFLMQKGANINIQDKEGNTPIHIAAHKHRKDVLIQFLIQKPDLTIKNDQDESVTDAIHAMNYDKDLATPIDRYQIYIDSSDDFYKDRNYLEEITKIINYYKMQRSPSWPIEQSLWCIESYKWHSKSMLPLFKLLLENGARPDLTWRPNEYGRFSSPLHLVAVLSDSEPLKLLVRYAHNINVRNWQGNTPLHIAVANERKDCVTILLENGALVNAVNNDGKTPLQLVENNKPKGWLESISNVLYTNQNNELIKIIKAKQPDKA